MIVTGSPALKGVGKVALHAVASCGTKGRGVEPDVSWTASM